MRNGAFGPYLYSSIMIKCIHSSLCIPFLMLIGSALTVLKLLLHTLCSGKLSREKTSIFRGLKTIHESFLREILWLHLHDNWTRAIHESFLREILVLYQNASFLPRNNNNYYIWPTSGTHSGLLAQMIHQIKSALLWKACHF